MSRSARALTLLALSAVANVASAQGVASGRVIDAQSSGPIADARIELVGTNLIATTNSDGRYTLRNLPNGTGILRAVRVGFQQTSRQVIVTSGATQTVDFTMTAAVIKLTEVVTTATGTQRRVELGNSVQTLGDIGAKVETAPVTNLADLLVAKAPGVQVLAGSMTGSAPSVRIRGIKSLSLSSEPIYVIDGVRMNAGAINIGTASAGNGTTASYLNVLNPEEIADIEIVKGPSAATLYGTDAANGVIVITTKKGTAGPARWTGHAGYGSVQDRNDYPTQYALFGHTPAKPTVPTRCLITAIASGACVQDSVTSYNLLADPQFSPITTGFTRSTGLQTSGGSESVRYFLSGDYEGEKGTLTMPDFNQRFLDSSGTKVRDEWINPEYFGRTSLRTNVNAAVTSNFDVGINAGYTRTGQRLPPVDNNTVSYLFQAYGNPGFKPTVACQTNAVSCLGYTDKGFLGEELGGYAQFTPANLFQRLNGLNIDRFITSANAQWRPLTWLQSDATVGMDDANRENIQICRFQECPASGTTREGFVTDTRSIDRNISAKIANNATWQVRPALNLKTTIGADYTNRQFEFSSASGNKLPPGAQTAGDAAVQSASSSFIQADKTLGYYAQEQASIRENLFITVAARTDQNSAFGTQFQRVVYPKASVSYLVSDESFFPHLSFLNQLRLRGAYGASGVQPNSTTAQQTYAASTVNLQSTATSTSGTDSPGLVAAALGNPELKPERSSERELGFETQLFGSRMNIDMTYYNNLTRDALISQPIAASAAPSQLSVTRNLGSVRNNGIEATITTTILDRRNFGWNLTVGGSHNTNTIESLGQQSCTVNATDCISGFKPNPTIGTGSNRDSVGKPIQGIFAKNYTYKDANGNGIIEPSEVTVDTNFSYLGYAVPRDLVTIQNSIDLFDKRVQLNVLLDYKGGFSIMNSTGNFLCRAKDTCYTETHTDAPLEDQARWVANRFLGTNAGYFESGQFWRLREIGATVQLPQMITNHFARDASLTLTGRNLHVWTKYTGTDPEANFAQTTSAGLGNVQNEILTTSPPTYFTARLNLHF